MAMVIGGVDDPNTLSKAIADALESLIPGFDREAGAQSLECIGNAIVQYLKDHAVVTVIGIASGDTTKTGTVE